MRKLKYGLLLILTMILFSVPVLAAKTTYYLPSKVDYSGDYSEYSYDKYGHIIKCHSVEEVVEGKYDDYTITWKYKCDTKGKRISGDEYYNGKLRAKLTFDKNDHLKTRKNVSASYEAKYKWNSKGYLEAENVLSHSRTRKYYYYNNGKIKKMAEFSDGELGTVAYFDKSGLRSKNPPKSDDYIVTYEYVLDKNGLVKTKIITTTYLRRVISVYKVKFYYSKTKTDAKTYFQFIDGLDSCRNNGNL